jgi:hypothetical protein
LSSSDSGKITNSLCGAGINSKKIAITCPLTGKKMFFGGARARVLKAEHFSPAITQPPTHPLNNHSIITSNNVIIFPPSLLYKMTKNQQP